jgi:hypothetical protein
MAGSTVFFVPFTIRVSAALGGYGDEATSYVDTEEGGGKQFMRVLPYHQQELEWLGTFLRSLTYMQTLEIPSEELQQ